MFSSDLRATEAWGGGIEPGIRDLVVRLRAAGINTVCSCEHARSVECEFSAESLPFLHSVMQSLGVLRYRVTSFCEVKGEGASQSMTVWLPDVDGEYACMSVDNPEYWSKKPQ